MRISGGFATLFATVAVLVADFLVSVKFPSLRYAACCSPGEHVGDLIAASGVAVAFVLTYLSALTGLPSPGRQLLTSALGHLKKQHPELAAIDEDGRITEAEFRRLQRFLDDAKDQEVHNANVQTAAKLFTLIVDLAKPPHIRPSPTVKELKTLGYSHVRSVFLSYIVFKRDAEKRLLLRATILCAIVFTYACVVYCLELAKLMPSSIVLLAGYPILAITGAGFASAMGLRMWPHVVRFDVIGPVIPPMEAAMQRQIEDSTQRLDEAIERAIDERKTLDEKKPNEKPLVDKPPDDKETGVPGNK